MGHEQEQRRPNRLIHEKSPYLLQHARNPVDWHPWGEEAFQTAHDEDKPVFLSVGYSTCHWCHVMAHESFEDPEVARLMNEAFVNIKVDREERPDIDQMYMTVCQLLTGHGGWPLNVLLTPDKKPFFAATYIPKSSRFGRKGMLDLIPRVKALWEHQRDEITRSAENVTDALTWASASQPRSGYELGEIHLHRAYEQLLSQFDGEHGGFAGAPKFPSPHILTFLLRYWKRTGAEHALHMVERTLQKMRCGGIYDHVGFGFHRYATDREWRVPHFEKMLYDQAMLTMAYTGAYQATHDAEYERTAREILEYVLRDMTAVEGGFYSAEDADSEGEEGKFYTWTSDEIRDVLDEAEAELVVKMLNVTKEGNYRDEATREPTGRNVLYLSRPFRELAAVFDLEEDELRKRWEAAREKLFGACARRVRPHKDDKILTDWNGLMIAALARGAAAFDEPAYAEAARKAAHFILSEMCAPEGRLLHRYREGEAAVPAFLDDYAFLIWGLIELYGATFDTGHLRVALELNDGLMERFWDEEDGGFFTTAHDAKDVLVRRKEFQDGALPSGNSVAMLNLLRLARMTGDPGLEERAAELGRGAAIPVEQAPMAHTQLLSAVDFALGPACEVVVAGAPDASETREMLRALRARFLPNTLVLLRPIDEEEPEIARIAPFTRGLTGQDGKATAYVCRDGHCELPTTDVTEMLEQLDTLAVDRA